MHPAINAFDARVDAALDSVRGPTLDRIFYRLSSAADHSLLWFGIGAARSIRTADVRFAVRFALTMGIESALTNGPVKALFRRSRPQADADTATGPLPYGLHRPITSSFPSGHATAAFTAAVVLAADRRRATPWYALASVVAMSRVYVRMHHASDIIGGAALGLAFGHALRRWVRRPTGGTPR